ncbi:MAG: ABC transporter transmembrane domain-containing protein, partial [Finegoldia magna]|nr:ABC transporter transmembrane domain-containing protein [Finegoldia magna]
FQYNFRLIGQTGSFQLRRNYFLNFLNQDYLLNSFKNPSELIVSITSDTSKINDFYGSGIVTFILMLANIITTVSVMIYFNYIIAIGVILLIVLGVLLTNKISEKIGELTVEFQKLSAVEQDQILQSIQGIKTIKMLMKEQFLQKNTMKV